jgi:hypothetical protein
MSSRAVRQFARTVLGTLTSPYFDTINVEQNPTDNVWVTAEFAALGSVKETYCEAWVEEGDIVLTFFGRPGIGDDALLQQAEADAARFYAGVDPAGKVVLVNKSAPEDFYITEEGPRFGVIFRFGYEFRA